MRKFISGLIVGIILTTSITVFASNYNVVPNPFKVIVDGEDKGQIGYLIDNSTYLPLRQMGDIIGKNVDFEDNTIYVGKVEANEDGYIITVDTDPQIETTYEGMEAIKYNGNIYLRTKHATDYYGYEIELIDGAIVFTKADSPSITPNKGDSNEVVNYSRSDDGQPTPYTNINLFE